MTGFGLNDTRSSLLVRLRDNEESAWREFFTLYTQVVFRYALRCGLQASDAEDITQEVLIGVAGSIRNFEYQPEKGRFRNWLSVIVRRRLARFWNSAQCCGQLPEETVDDRQMDPIWQDEFQATILAAAMQNVQPRFADITWQIFESTWKNDESASHVAERLKVPIEVVYNAKSRVLKQLESEVLRISDDCAWFPGN